MSQLISQKLERNRSVDLTALRKPEYDSLRAKHELEASVEQKEMEDALEDKLMFLQDSLLGTEIRMVSATSWSDVKYYIAPANNIIARSFNTNLVSFEITRGDEGEYKLLLCETSKRAYDEMGRKEVARLNLTYNTEDESKLVDIAAEILTYPPYWVQRNKVRSRTRKLSMLFLLSAMVSVMSFFVLNSAEKSLYALYALIVMCFGGLFLMLFSLILLNRVIGFRQWDAMFSVEKEMEVKNGEI